MNSIDQFKYPHVLRSEVCLVFSSSLKGNKSKYVASFFELNCMSKWWNFTRSCTLWSLWSLRSVFLAEANLINAFPGLYDIVTIYVRSLGYAACLGAHWSILLVVRAKHTGKLHCSTCIHITCNPIEQNWFFCNEARVKRKGHFRYLRHVLFNVTMRIRAVWSEASLSTAKSITSKQHISG